MQWLLMPLQWNFVLVTSLVASLAAQLVKVVLNLIIIGKFIPERIWGAGGMPSSHSATVCAMVVATGRYCGVDSTLFAIAVVLSVIVMYDAMGVRRETGEQTKVLNQMLNEWMDESAQSMPWLADKRLKVMVGHTPILVLAGAEPAARRAAFEVAYAFVMSVPVGFCLFRWAGPSSASCGSSRFGSPAYAASAAPLACAPRKYSAARASSFN